jgi:hypothetical protein
MAQIKGTAIRGLLKHVKESAYPGGIAAVIAELPPETRKVFDQRILASSWYPYAAYADLLPLIARHLGSGRDPLATLGRWLAKQDAGTTFKVVSLFASVETMLQRGHMFWSRHCDTGRFETFEVQKGSGAGALVDFPDVHPLHCGLLAGWIAGMAEAAGAKTATARKTKCVHRGDPHCEYRGTWT